MITRKITRNYLSTNIFLAFLATNELNIKIFYKNYIFGNKNLINGTFCRFLKLGQMFVLKYVFFNRIFPYNENIGT